MMSPGGDVDLSYACHVPPVGMLKTVLCGPRGYRSLEIQNSRDWKEAGINNSEARNYGVTWHDDVIRNDMDRWDVCHMSMGFTPTKD
jgi:hypothetical protein